MAQSELRPKEAEKCSVPGCPGGENGLENISQVYAAAPMATLPSLLVDGLRIDL